MTYREMEDLIAMRLGGRSVVDKFFPVQYAEVPAAVKRACRKVAEMIDPTFETFIIPSQATITGDGETTSFNINDLLNAGEEFMRAKGLKYGDTFIDYTTQRLVNKVLEDDLGDETSLKVYIYGQNLVVMPALPSGATATFYYYVYPAETTEGQGSVPNLSAVPAAYHEAIAYYAIWDLGHKLSTLSNYNPEYYYQSFRQSFMDAQKGQTEGFADNVPHLIDIYDGESEL